MITLYIVRHGETMHNLENRIQGHTDSPLTLLGIRQAEAAASRLASEKFDAIYSSDLGRAKATAEIIASYHKLPVRTTELLREANLGVSQGLTRDEFAQRYPEAYRLWREDSVKNRPPGAETLEQVIERCGKFIEQVAIDHVDGENIVVIGHGGSVRGLVCAAFDLPVRFYRSIYTSNTGLTIIELGKPTRLRVLNDSCHLDRIATEADVDNEGVGSRE